MPTDVAYYSTSVKLAYASQLNAIGPWVDHHSPMPVAKIHQSKSPHRFHYIAEWLEKRGLKQSDVVRELGVDKGTVSKWCAGSLPQETNLIRLAAMLHVEPISLFRHPDDDWIAQLFRDRNQDELKRMADTLRAAFPRKQAASDS